MNENQLKKLHLWI